jgi:5-hydroxyisourate hydrolase-like protein (transthyretin family)
MASWDAATKQAQRDAGTAIIEYIEDEITNGETEITIPTGDYRFDQLIGSKADLHVLFLDLVDITIDFNDSTFWMENAKTAILFYRCINMTAKNLTIDYDPLPFIQGTITSIDSANNKIHVALDAGYETPAPRLLDGGKWRGAAFDPNTRELKHHVKAYALTVNWANTNSNGDYIISYNGFDATNVSTSGLEVDDLIAIFPRLGRAVRMEICEGMHLENFTLYASPFIGYTVYGGVGDFVLRNCNIDRRPGTDRLMGCNADGINVSGLTKGPLIEDCTLNYLGDDAVNIHSAYNRLIKAENSVDGVGTTSLISSRVNGYAVREISDNGTPIKIYFFDHDTMNPIGERYIIGVENNLNWYIDENDCLAKVGPGEDRWYSGEAAQIIYGNTILVDRLTLDQPIIIENDTITVLEGYTSSGGIVRRVSTKGSIARGFRLQSPDLIVQDCTLEDILGHGISLAGQPHYWGEGPYVKNAQILNNQLINTTVGIGSQEVAAIMIRQGGDYQANYIQENITVANNIISGSGAAAIIARGVKDLTIANNQVTDYWQYPPETLNAPLDPSIQGTGYAIVVESIDGLTLKNNSIREPGAYAVGPLFLHTIVNGPDDELLDPGSAIEVERNGNGGGFEYAFSPTHASDELLSFSFKYWMVNTGNNDLNLTALVDDSSSTAGLYLQLWAPDGSGGFGIANQMTSGSNLLGFPVGHNQWYTVEILIDSITQNNDNYTVVFTNEYNETFVAYDLPFHTDINELNDIRFIDNSTTAGTGGFLLADLRIGYTPLRDLGEPDPTSSVGDHSDLSISAVISEETSPFPKLGLNSEAVSYSDTSTIAGVGAGIDYKIFPNPAKAFKSVIFDFKVPDPTNNDLRLTAGLTDSDGTVGNFLLLHQPDGLGGYELAYQIGNGVHSLGIPVKANTWHRMEMLVKDFSGSNDHFTVFMNAENEPTRIAANIPFRFNIDDITYLQIWNNADDSRQGSFLVDNVHVGDVPVGSNYGLGEATQFGGFGSNTTVQDAVELSPFPWLSDKNFTYIDTSTSYGIGACVAYSFTNDDPDAPLIASFDFKIHSNPPSDLALTFSLSDNGSNGNFLMLDYDDGTGIHYFANKLDSGNTTLSSVDADTWYHVEVEVENISESGDVYQLRITDENGITTTHSNLPFRFARDTVNSLRFYNNSDNSATGSYTIDNVRLSTQLVIH